jgi:hypothetical protein
MQDLSHLVTGDFLQPPPQQQPTVPIAFPTFTIETPAQQRVQLADARYLVWFKGRTTPVVVDADDRSAAITKARAKANRGGDGPVVEARQPTAAENKQISNGNWVTTRPKGKEGMKSSFKK